MTANIEMKSSESQAPLRGEMVKAYTFALSNMAAMANIIDLCSKNHSGGSAMLLDN